MNGSLEARIVLDREAIADSVGTPSLACAGISTNACIHFEDPHVHGVALDAMELSRRRVRSTDFRKFSLKLIPYFLDARRVSIQEFFGIAGAREFRALKSHIASTTDTDRRRGIDGSEQKGIAHRLSGSTFHRLKRKFEFSDSLT